MLALYQAPLFKELIMEKDKLKRLVNLQKQHFDLQMHISELEDLILANERNLGRGKFKDKARIKKIIKSYESKRTANNLERYNLVYGNIH